MDLRILIALKLAMFSVSDHLKVRSWQYLQKVIIAVKVDKDAHIHSQDRQQYAGQGYCRELVDKPYTNKHDEAHNQ
jgi:hypothetical protein